MRDSDQMDEILKLNIPVIVVRHRLKELKNQINIISDSEAIGKLAANHLLECELQHYAYCGMNNMTWSTARCEFFSWQIQKAGYEVHIFNKEQNEKNESFTKERQQLLQWLIDLPKPVGIMACNDDRSQHIVQACKQAHILMPDEVAIIGVDNDELVCELSDPQLSSVGLNFERAGYEAASILDKLMHGKPVKKKNILVPVTHVAMRRSTDISFIQDQDVAKAIQFIRKNANKLIRVDDVVNTVPFTRRTLENKFRKILKRSILSEIRRVRVNLISRMLLESNMSVLDISLSLGFHGSEHISRYFKREKGISLLKFRKLYGQK